MTKPRSVPEWDEYFLRMAIGAAGRSKDPSTQHGAVIVDASRRVLGVGFNGGARGIPDDAIDWSRPNKYDWVIHAEENALWYSRMLDLSGCTLYVTGPPCPRCMLRLVHCGIREIIHGPNESASVGEREKNLSKQMAELSGTKVRVVNLEKK